MHCWHKRSTLELVSQTPQTRDDQGFLHSGGCAHNTYNLAIIQSQESANIRKFRADPSVPGKVFFFAVRFGAICVAHHTDV
jgi:hypothetical protein